MSSQGKSKGFTILFAPSPICNLRCTYCPLPKTLPQIDWFQIVQNMEQLLKMMENYLNEYPTDNISFIIHGNEPTVIGTNKIVEILEQVNMIRKRTGRITIGMQTNGTLITDELAKIIKKYDLEIGISIDGWKEAHNANRKYVNGVPSYDDALRGVKILQKYNIPFGIISVVTKAHMKMGAKRGAQRYYRWLEENNIQSALIHIVSMSKNMENYNEIHPSYAEYIEFFLTLYEIWKNKNDGIALGPFTDMIEALLFGKRYDGGMCAFREEHCAPIIEIRYDGEIYTCDRHTYKLGNIKKYADLKDILDKAMASAGKRSQLLKEQDFVCASCKYWDACHGGCTHEGMMRYFDILAEEELPRIKDSHIYRTKYCTIYRVLFKIIEKDLKKMGYSLAI